MIEPDKVKVEAEKLEEENYKFRRFLKGRADSDKLDAQFLELHNELFDSYDCSKCANCCKECGTTLAGDEVAMIAAFLGLPLDRFVAEYLAEVDEDGEMPYVFKEKPCPFLDDEGHCRIEGCQPEVCVGFPYTDQPDRMSSLLSIIDHAGICPVVFEILERLKKMYGFRGQRR